MRAVDNPKNRFEPAEIAWDEGEAPLALLHVHEEQAKSIVSENQSPDLPFRYSINPYRGCQHACAYCYARPSHQYWGFGAGTDFEREIIVKRNAPELLRETFARSSWKGDSITFSGNTDCYQPLEGRYRLTRELLSVCLEHKNPVALITKSPLVQRDLDILCELSRSASLVVFVSIAFADEQTARALEPGAPAIHRRFEALAALSAAGIETGVAVAPIIPGVNDRDLGRVLQLAHQAGARRAFHTLLRLPAEVRPVFLSRLREALPGSADKVEHGLVELRGGKRSDSRFGERMHGEGPRWEAIDDLFDLQCKRLGLNAEPSEERASTFERPSAQLRLF
ncbi:MAG: PA0069 family radical SAM protein [Polyangiales bacterium]